MTEDVAFRWVQPWPRSFIVGLVGATSTGMWRGHGHLEIEPGRVTCHPSKRFRGIKGAEPLTLEAKELDLYVPRLIPPWFNVTVPVRAGQRLMSAEFPIWLKPGIIRALRGAGFTVHQHNTWTHRGYTWDEMYRSAL